MKKNIIKMALVFIGLAGSLWSCTENELTPSTHFADNVIAFSVGANTTGAAASATRSEVNTYELQADDAAGDVLPVYLTESIEPMDEIGSESDMLTRGTPIYTENFAQYYTAFQAVAYAPGTKTTTAFTADDISLPPFEMTKDGDTDYWKHTFEAGTKWWPADNDKLAFFYAAPVVADGETAPYTNLAYGLNEGKPVITFDYTSPATAVEQKDILFSGKVLTKNAYEAASKTVNGSRILFYHPLAAVKFKQTKLEAPEGSDITDLHVSSISFTGVNDKGSCTITVPDYGEEPKSEPDGGKSEKSESVVAWSDLEAVKGTISQTFGADDLTDGDDFTAPESFKSAKKDGEETNPATDNINDKDYSKTFMIIPQTLGGGAKLVVEISYKRNGVDAKETRTLPLEGTWKAGNMYTYGITLTPSDWEYHLEVEMPMTTFSYLGGVQNLNVQSWKVNRSTGEKVKVSWKMKFKAKTTDAASDDMPDFFGEKTKTSGEGIVPDGVEVVPVEFTHANLLEGVDPISFREAYAEPVDLSSVDESGEYSGTPLQNTANSYVINAPGTYRIPLVYGNAIRHGGVNEGAYITQGHLKNFLNHADKPITSPYIQANLDTDDALIGTKTLTAELVWQDSKSLVKNVTIGNYPDKTYDGTNDLSYLQFDVPAASLVQGNALLAVKADGVIVWSWQIWTTPRPVYDAVKVETADDHVIHFMPIALGEVLQEEKCTFYEPRKYYIEIVQDESGIGRSVLASQTYELVQTGGEEFFGVSPYYQFGRKDPMPRGSLKNAPNLSYIAEMFDINDHTINYDGSGAKGDYAESKEYPKSRNTSDEEDYPEQEEYEPPFYVNDEADCGITRSIGGAIQNPQCFFGVEGGQWGHAWDYYYTVDEEGRFKTNGVTYINLWSANASEVVTWTDNYYESNIANYKPSPFTIDIKTVYDPCPVGFKVPELADFSHAFDPRHTVIRYNEKTKSYVAAFGDNYITVPTIGHMQTGARGYNGDIHTPNVCAITKAGTNNQWRGYYTTSTISDQAVNDSCHEYWYISSGDDDGGTGVYFTIICEFGYQDYAQPVLPVRERY